MEVEKSARGQGASATSASRDRFGILGWSIVNPEKGEMMTNVNILVMAAVVGLFALGCKGETTVDDPNNGTDDMGSMDGNLPDPDAGNPDPDPIDIGLEACEPATFDRQPAVFAGLESTYFVSKYGDDTNDGTSPESAFATISRGIEAMSAGDTLTIGPGEYHENLYSEGLGSADVDTVIQAAIPGTVILRGDVDAPAFEKVDGYDFVWVADFDGDRDVQMVNELDTLTQIESSPSLGELEVTPARFYQDVEDDKLYISTSDRRSALGHRYSISVIHTHGIYFDDSVRLIVDGLAATGFTTATQITHREHTSRTVWGMFFHNTQQSTLRNAHVWMNGRGIGTYSAEDYAFGNVVEFATARGNYSRAGNGQGDLGGITLFQPQQDEIRDSQAFLNGEYGINIRGGGEDGRLESHQSFMRRSLAWGNGAEDFKIKTGYDSIHEAQNCVALGTVSNTPNAVNCLMGRGSTSRFDDSNIILEHVDGLDPGAEFADPANRDYRLQEGSRFIGSGPDGQDQGPYPYEANVYFVAPDGPGGSGLSVATAFGSIELALRELGPGDTLYIEPGNYDEDVVVELAGTAEEPISVRGRGTEPVIISGTVSLGESEHVRFERLHFAAGVAVTDSSHVSFENASFGAPEVGLDAQGVAGLKLVHNIFTGFSQAGVSAQGSSEVYLAGNLFDNVEAVGVRVDDPSSILYSNYNGFRQATIAWQVDDQGCSLDDASPAYELSSVRVEPALDLGDGRPVVANVDAVEALGPFSRPLGNYRDQTRDNELWLTEDPTVHSVSSTTANLEWGTSLPATTTFTWGPTPAMENEVDFEVLYAGNYSFTGLQPDTTYYFQIKSLSIPNIVDIELDPVEVTSPVVEFTTAASDAAPVTYYVAPDGDDANDGTSRAQAFSTIQRAANVVNVGDTVLIDEGLYEERVIVRATGAPGAPITFKNVPGAKVRIEGGQGRLTQGFVVAAKEHLNFDGFFFDWFSSSSAFAIGPDARFDSWRGGQSGQFNLYESRDITVSRILSDGRLASDARDITAHNVTNLTVSNMVSTNKFGGCLYLLATPGLRVENSVFLRPQISAFLLRNESEHDSVWENNIITDSLNKKAELNISLLTVDRTRDLLTMRNTLFFLRDLFAPEERHLIGTRSYSDMPDVFEGTVFGDPRFAGIEELVMMGESYPDFSPDRFAGALDIEYDFGKFMTTNAAFDGIGLEPDKFTNGLPN